MLTKIFKEKSIDEFKTLLDDTNNPTIITHISPDGDAIGSTLALYHYLKTLNVNATIVVPNSFPTFLKWMDGSEDIIIFDKQEEKAKEVLKESDLIFCLDFNISSRVGKNMSQFVESLDTNKIMIDHHPYPDDFCDIVISHPEISSTSEIIFRLICFLGDFDNINIEAATAIYVGMMTDTGAFTYNSNNAEIYNIISRLISIGIDKDEIYRKVYNNYTVDRFRLQGYVLSDKLSIYDGYNTACITLNNEEQKRFHVKKGDTEGFCNMPLSISNIIFAAFFKQDQEDPNLIKISLRSQGDFPCNKFSSECFGGGGHLNAAGGEFYGSMDELISKFEKHLQQYKNELN